MTLSLETELTEWISLIKSIVIVGPDWNNNAKVAAGKTFARPAIGKGHRFGQSYHGRRGLGISRVGSLSPGATAFTTSVFQKVCFVDLCIGGRTVCTFLLAVVALFL